MAEGEAEKRLAEFYRVVTGAPPAPAEQVEKILAWERRQTAVVRQRVKTCVLAAVGAACSNPVPQEHMLDVLAFLLNSILEDEEGERD